jgi:hypothetical protein
MGGTVGANTEYLLKMVVSGNGTVFTFSVNGSGTQQLTSGGGANLPTTTTSLAMAVQVVTLSANVRTMHVDRLVYLGN